jgi:hypothetical protein
MREFSGRQERIPDRQLKSLAVLQHWFSPYIAASQVP